MSVTLENVTVSYHRHPAVHHISGRFEDGSLTAVTGPNGAGKSTLLKALAGMLTPEEGKIRIEHPLSSPSPQAGEGMVRTIAYVPQAAEVQRDFPISVLLMVATGYWHKTGNGGAITAAMKEQAAEALAAVGLKGLEKRAISSLSTGQFQRAQFARLLLQDAPLMLLDEPFAAIDAGTAEQLLKMIGLWHKEKRTVICVLHDLDQIRRHFPQCLLLARECIAWGESDKALAPEHIMRAFTSCGTRSVSAGPLTICTEDDPVLPPICVSQDKK